MTLLARATGAIVGGFLFIATCGFRTEEANLQIPDYIVTAAPIYEVHAALKGGERFPEGAHLLLVHNGKAVPLAPEFAASADAAVNFDAKKILFSGKKTVSDHWQIWEMTLADHSVRQVTSGNEDAIRPLYLPLGRLVYAEHTEQGFRMISSRVNDTAEIRGIDLPGIPSVFPISFAGASAIPDDVLADGRILFESEFPMGKGSIPEMYLTYADGSGVESYRCDHGVARWGGQQLADGDVVFTHGTTLARFTPSLAHEAKIAAPAVFYAGSIQEMPAGSWLLSAKMRGSAKFSIAQWQPGTSTLKAVFEQPRENLVEPVAIAARVRPKRHPSALHPWKYANLLALDTRLSRDGALGGVPARVRLEMESREGRAIVLGTAPVEQDGSFFIQVPGDAPIRMAVLDEKGEVLRQERGWFWARAGEQRICVGCHTGPERAAENRLPEVLQKTTVPVDLTGSTAGLSSGEGSHR
ncbi:MAG: hypothetical protein KGN79_11240 [Acidobacteriota bacterium]|nr:hypothetical protein [Acidobacteriota bacterium]